MRSVVVLCFLPHIHVGDKKFPLLTKEIEDPEHFYTRTLVCKITAKYIFLVISILILIGVVIWCSVTISNTQEFKFEKCE